MFYPSIKLESKWNVLKCIRQADSKAHVHHGNGIHAICSSVSFLRALNHTMAIWLLQKALLWYS